ncbi:MAG: hypothetical protein ACLT33_09400 [Lachnospira pectinoschiza]
MNFLAIIGDYIGRVFLKRENMINRYVALDVETTGLNPAVDRIRNWNGKWKMVR